jgi:uncharacterized protein
MKIQTQAERDAYYNGIKVGGIIILILVFLISNVSAATTIPRIEPYVNDFAGVLSPQEELQLNLLADQIENRTSFEIAIVTVTGTGGQDRLEYANLIGDQNGVGKKDSDNGVVVLWSMDVDKGGAIATGRGSESFITDATTGTIGRATRPYFDKGEYYNGMNYIVTELDKVIVAHQLEENATVVLGGNIDNPFGDYLSTTIIIFILFAGLAIVLAKLFGSIIRSGDSDDSDYYEPEEGDPGYWRNQVYKRKGKWYHPKADRSYSTAAAAAAALAIISNSSDNDDSDDDDDSSSGSSSSGSGGGFGGFGGGNFGGGGGKF